MAAAVAAPVHNPFIEFRNRYYHHPDLLVEEVLGAQLDAEQRAVLLDVAAGHRRISVRSGHGVGKTAMLSFVCIWFILTRFPQKTVCTAPTSDQLFDALATEIKKWITKLPPLVQELLEVQTEKIFLKAAPNESFISFRTSRPEKPEAMAGVHSENVLLIGDEASGIPDVVFESAEGSMSGHNATMILTGNPIRTSGRFFDTHTKLRGIWKTHHISCIGHPRVSAESVEEKRRTYGEHSNAYRVRVLGEFPVGDDDTVIPFEHMESALKRDVTPHLVKPIWGVDCARYGSDSSALARRKGNVLMQKVEERRGYDTMRVTGWIKNEWDITPLSDRPSEILVDSIGIGSGVVDRLAELGLPAFGINVSEAPTIFDEQYLNLRAELWFKGKAWLAAKDCSLAGDEGLGGELVAPRFSYQSNGKIKVESKEDLKKRSHPSPNRADAFLLTLARDAVTAIGGAKTQTSWKTPLRRVLKGLT